MSEIVPRRADKLGAVVVSPARLVLASVGAGVTVGLLEYAIHTLATRENLAFDAPTAVDAATVALLAGALVYTVLEVWRRRRAEVMEQLRVVAELNHNVRNALQAIVYSQRLPPQEQTQIILDNVNRIEATLTELFPAMDGKKAGVKKPQPNR